MSGGTGPAAYPPPRRGVNLLPPDEVRRQRVRALGLRVGGAVAAGTTLVALTSGGLWASAQSERAGLERARTDQDRLLAAAAGAAELAQVTADLERTEGRLGPELAQDVRWSRYLSDLSAAIPDSTWLLYLSAAASSTAADEAGTGARGAGVGQVRFTGRAFRHGDVATFLTALSRVRGTSSPYLLESVARTDEAGRDVVEFTGYATVTADALSSRAGE